MPWLNPPSVLLGMPEIRPEMFSLWQCKVQEHLVNLRFPTTNKRGNFFELLVCSAACCLCSWRKWSLGWQGHYFAGSSFAAGSARVPLLAEVTTLTPRRKQTKSKANWKWENYAANWRSWGLELENWAGSCAIAGCCSKGWICSGRRI